MPPFSQEMKRYLVVEHHPSNPLSTTIKGWFHDKLEAVTCATDRVAHDVEPFSIFYVIDTLDAIGYQRVETVTVNIIQHVQRG